MGSPPVYGSPRRLSLRARSPEPDLRTRLQQGVEKGWLQCPQPGGPEVSAVACRHRHAPTWDCLTFFSVGPVSQSGIKNEKPTNREIKVAFDRLIRRFNIIEERMSELEDNKYAN